MVPELCICIDHTISVLILLETLVENRDHWSGMALLLISRNVVLLNVLTRNLKIGYNHTIMTYNLCHFAYFVYTFLFLYAKHDVLPVPITHFI